jgi:hypothetical protein
MSMSKQIGTARQGHVRGRRSLILVSAVLLCLSAILFETYVGSAQNPVATSTARNAALVAATEEVLNETSELRHLAVMRPVKSGTQSREEIQRAIMKSFDEETTPAQLHASEGTLKRMGLVPADFHYRQFMIDLLTEQVAGYYEPKTQEFHLADWINLDAQKPIMAHELTHALQDQHFNLRRFEHWPKGDSDAELAAHALVEGDATMAMILYVSRNPLRALAFMRSLGATGVSSEQIDKAPRALRETLLFPYLEGQKWVSALYKRCDCWDEVSKAFTTLPQSTEQLLHTEKYFAHEAPVKINLPDISPQLNSGERGQEKGGRARRSSGASATPNSKLPAPVSSWRRIDYDVNGEWGLYLILDTFLKSRAESNRAAAGWGGDRYEVLESNDGRTLLAMMTAWDTEQDAREFFDAYLKRTQLRYPDAAAVAATAPTNDSRTFQTSEGAVIIELRGLRVLILEGLPRVSDLPVILKALSQ